MKKIFWFVTLPVGMLVFLLVLMTGTLVTFVLPKHYLSEAQVKTTSATTPEIGSQDWYESQFEAIRCDAVLLPVIEKSNLRKQWGDRFANGQSLTEPLCLALLRSRLNLKPVRHTDFIRIGIISDEPREAAELANAVSSAYVDYCATNAGGVQVTVINKADMPLRPFAPKVTLNIMLSMAIGVILGAAIGVGGGWLFCFLRKRGSDSGTTANSCS